MALFEKGKSGNPGGRPKLDNEVRDLARLHSKEAIEKLVIWMQSDDARASIAASNSILDRAYGKPLQAIAGDEEGGPVRLVIERVILDSQDQH